MFGKLMKYEFKAQGRILLPLYGAVILMGIISSLFTRAFNNDMLNSMTFMRFFMLLFIIVYVCILLGSGIMCLILSILRFKKNLLGDEGYLMHTLPVKKWQLVSSKLITAVVMQLLGIIVGGISGFLLFWINGSLDLSGLGEALSEIFAYLPDFGILGALTVFEVILISLIMLAGMNLMFYASLSLGYSGNSHKMLRSVGVFIGFYFITQIISFNYLSLLFGSFDNAPNIESYTHAFSALQPYLLAVLALELVYAAAYFFITSITMKRKLNI